MTRSARLTHTNFSEFFYFSTLKMRSYLTLLKDPFLRALCPQLLNILEHVKDDILDMHWKHRDNSSSYKEK